MCAYVLNFQDIDKKKLPMVGGKGANLGELSRIKDIHVPDGCCITTDAYKSITGNNPELNSLLDELVYCKAADRKSISVVSAKIRAVIENIPVSTEITAAIIGCLATLGEQSAFAVRSSATAEDLPAASFAGQQDTYLNITGKEAILQHISKCWASLFTERAVTYRIQQGYDHRKVLPAVVVQKMIFPHAAGIMFTADPVTANRKVVSIDAGFGLGEALVAGLVNPDVYKARNGQVTDKRIAVKKLAIYAVRDGGTAQQEIAPEQQQRPVLTDEQVLQLEQAGRKIEAHFGCPQDIEWCLADNTFYIVQSRPITTLYPIPEADPLEKHVYVSVGHQQMMTDAMKPLGISVWQLTAGRPMYAAGGRFFVDIAKELASPVSRSMIVDVLGKSDPLLRDALTTVIERGDIIAASPADKPEPAPGSKGASLPDFKALKDYDPAIVTELVKSSRASIAALKENIQTKSGPALVDFILEDIRLFRESRTDRQSFEVIMTGMNAAAWLNDKIQEWLGQKNVADTLSQSVPNNITSEMGLELLDVADVIRPYPEVIDYLAHAKEDDFLAELATLKGGQEAKAAICTYLDKYGMRCTGEIDITRTRWSEKPAILAPMILSNIRKLAPGAGQQKFERGRQEALEKEQELLILLRQLPDGEQKADETKRMINLVRNLAGYREYPKYAIVSRYFIYKQALMKEAEQLLQAGVIREKEDVYYLSFDELRELIRTRKPDYQAIDKRKEEYRLYEKLTPPRIMTSDGEVITGAYKRENIPGNAIVGLPVSSGIIEGRARVILDMEDAALEEGDILVTPFTDPGWTPLFVSIKGLVTEVGGLMTHGAVIAREYGLPAVVGVEHATRLIKDGQRIRVNGTDGYIEII